MTGKSIEELEKAEKDFEEKSENLTRFVYAKHDIVGVSAYRGLPNREARIFAEGMGNFTKDLIAESEAAANKELDQNVKSR